MNYMLVSDGSGTGLEITGYIGNVSGKWGWVGMGKSG